MCRRRVSRDQRGLRTRDVERRLAWSWPTAAPALDQAERAVVVGQIASQVVAGGLVRAGLLELFAQHGRGLDMGRVGDSLVARTGVGAGSTVLEVGAGTGQATRAVATLGGSVTAIEPGPDMAALARRNLAGRDDVTVVTAKSEDWDDRVAASTCWCRRRRGTGLTRRLAGDAPTTCCAREAGWRCWVMSSSAARAGDLFQRGLLQFRVGQ